MASAKQRQLQTVSFWYRLQNNPFYRTVMGVATASRRRRILFLAILPIIWLLLTHLGPLLQVLRISLMSAYPLTAGQEATVTGAHYLTFVSEQIYLKPYFRTLVFATTVTLVTLICVYPVAYYIAKGVPRNRQIRYLLLLLMPFWVSYIIRTFAFMVLLGNRGFVNIVLLWLGLTERPIPFMYTYFSLSMGVLYLTVLYMVLPLYAAIEKIDDNLLAAAADLGAGPITRFWRITLPLSKEGIASGCALVFLLSTGYYAVPLLLGGPNTTLFAETVGNFFRVAGDRWPVGAAFALIMLLTSLGLCLIFLKLIGSRGARIIK